MRYGFEKYVVDISMQKQFTNLLLNDKGCPLSHYSKKHPDNSIMIKVTKKQALFILWSELSEININEGDFTAVPSPLRFDLLDSHLLGEPSPPTKKWGKGPARRGPARQWQE